MAEIMQVGNYFFAGQTSASNVNSESVLTAMRKLDILFTHTVLISSVTDLTENDV